MQPPQWKQQLFVRRLKQNTLNVHYSNKINFIHHYKLRNIPIYSCANNKTKILTDIVNAVPPNDVALKTSCSSVSMMSSIGVPTHDNKPSRSLTMPRTDVSSAWNAVNASGNITVWKLKFRSCNKNNSGKAADFVNWQHYYTVGQKTYPFAFLITMSIHVQFG